MASQHIWTKRAVKTELQHWLCCDPSGRPCNLRLRDVEQVRGRSTQNEGWASFQLSAHGRGDIANALTAVFDIPTAMNWGNLSVAEVRELPRLAQAIWVLVTRGPYDGLGRGPQLPETEKERGPRFGFLPWKVASKLLRRSRRHIQDDISEAIRQIAEYLSPWREVNDKLTAAWRGMRCTNRIHVFSVSGNPPADIAPCFCHRYTWLEWKVELAARLLEPC